MSETKTLETPTDTPATNVEGDGKKKRKPRRQTRLFDDGGGDYRFYEIVGPNQNMPQGALVPVADLGGFPNSVEATKALKDHGDKLTGKQMILVRGVSIVKIELETNPRVKIASKERRAVGE